MLPMGQQRPIFSYRPERPSGARPEVIPEDAAGRARLDRARQYAWLLDSAFRVPGTNFRFGIEPLISLVPGLGDIAGAGLSLTLIYNAARLGISKVVLARMAGNVLLEALVGTIPLVGDAWDFFYKANRRNYALLERHLHSGSRRAERSDWFWLASVIVMGALAVLIPVVVLALVLLGAASLLAGPAGW